MLKALAVLRTLFLVFIVGYTVRAWLPSADMARTLDEQYARCAWSFGELLRAAWLAIGWILLETAIGWWMATRRRPAAKPVAAPAGGPPVAPTPHR